MRIFGEKSGFAFEAGELADHGCRLSLWINNELIWAEEDSEGRRPISIDPVSFLYHMGIYWINIFYSQSFSEYDEIVFSSNGPEQCIKDILFGYANDDSVSSEKKEEELLIFDRIHNMSLWNDESCLPSVYMFKVGNKMRFFYDENKISFDLAYIREIFESFGEYISNELFSIDKNGHAPTAWRNRYSVDTAGLIALKSGITEQDYPISYEILKNDVESRSDAHRLRDTPYSIAARLSRGTVDDGAMSELLAVLREIKTISDPFPISENLLHLSGNATAFLQSGNSGNSDPNWLDGNALANFVREQMGIQEAFVDIRSILGDLGVAILERRLPSEIYALALWEDLNAAPMIVTNSRHSDGYHKEAGMRANLAHELCHILVDRENTLPVADILFNGRKTPMEQRARAFAAEFLCPENLAADLLSSSAKDISLVELASKFQVSRSVLAFQLCHSNRLDAVSGATKIKREVKAIVAEAQSRLQGDLY